VAGVRARGAVAAEDLGFGEARRACIRPRRAPPRLRA